MRNQAAQNQTIGAKYNLADQLNSKCITSINANTNRNYFLFCTNSIRKQNQVHLIEYDEDQGKISKNLIYNHPGVIHQIFSDPKNESQFYTTYSKINGLAQSHHISLCSMQSLDGPKQFTSDAQNANQLFTFDTLEQINSVVFLAKDDQLLLTDQNQIQIFDINKQYAMPLFQQKNGFYKTEIDPHHQNLIASISGDGIQMHDIREKNTSFQINSAHNGQILDMDFNPNKQYYMITSGEDCLIKFWEIRKPKIPMKIIDEELPNWVLSCKYNKYHDQLILTSCDDGSIHLHKSVQTSSAPMLGNISNDEDKVIKQYDEYDDSVYSITWSAASAWIFASISYNGNVIINLVPTAEKYRILL